MVEYVSVDPGQGLFSSEPNDHWKYIFYWPRPELTKLSTTCLGPLSAIGEQKATQLFARLASRFDKNAGTLYEAIFIAWGGDVRERSIDLATGRIRPRKLALGPPVATTYGKDPPPEYYDQRLTADPTVYARIDYLDPNAKITNEERQSCRTILEDLPVVFTFAPMNLLYYQVKFAPHSTRTVTVRYRQYAYADTRGPGSYQLAYVLHPATLWKEFGPIEITVRVPKGIACRASAAIERTGEVQAERGGTADKSEFDTPSSHKSYQATIYQATLAKPEEKSGELFVGIDKAAWDKLFPPEKPQSPPEKPEKAPPRKRTCPIHPPAILALGTHLPSQFTTEGELSNEDSHSIGSGGFSGRGLGCGPVGPWQRRAVRGEASQRRPGRQGRAGTHRPDT